MERYSIYALIDPTTGHFFYVGQTVQPIATRLGCHMYEYSNPKNPRTLKHEIIISLLSKGLKPEIKEIDYTFSDKPVFALEKHWMFKLKEYGHPIVNKQVCKQWKYEVYYTTNFPYGVSVREGGEVPTKILMYGKHKNRVDPEFVVSKDHACYLEVHENDYYDGLCVELRRLKETVYPFLIRPMTDAEAIAEGLINENGDDINSLTQLIN